MIHANIRRFGAIGSLLVIGLLALALVASTTASASTFGTRTTTDSPNAASKKNTPTPNPTPTTGATFQGLGQMPGVVIQPGQCGTQALGISGDGSVIVGAGCVSSTNNEAFRWTLTGGYQRLGNLGGGTSDARAASLDGSVVVGQSIDSSGAYRAYRWTAALGMVALPFNPPSGAVNEGDTVTDDGTMVAGGNAWWKTSGQTGNFGSCGDAQISLAMVDLSADGSVAAGSGPFGTPFMGDFFHAYRSTPTGNCQDIDPVGNRNSDASGISADGLVIVGEEQVGGPYLAFRWTASTGIVNLGDLGGGLSDADATNRDGSVVVGHSLTSGSSSSAHAFVWTAKCGMQDLQMILQHQGAKIPNGWILQVATDISEDGAVITGWGISPPVQGSKFGQTESWRATLPVVC
jgi:probable HAF family extracellular repeat protein